ncbi:hypothetical protein SAMN02745866_01432 [Alteromonadaceae bacterium Bs31]|nr:hypothetical protein SAMN02745866_01432 [Alteromonadaceae bacterium Bs31]
MKCKLFVFLIALVVSSNSQSVTFEYAIALYQEKQFEVAYSGFLELAGLGNGRAQLNLGVMYARGEHVEKDFVEAYAWAKLASESEDVDAEKILSILGKRLDEEGMSAAETRYKTLNSKYGTKAVSSALLPSETAGEAMGFAEARIKRKRTPSYPKNEIKRGASGLVDVQYSIGIDGTVRNIGVLKTTSKFFTDSTLKALKSWIYEPAKVDGKPVEEFGRRMRFKFQFEGSELQLEKTKKYIEQFRVAAEQGGGRQKYEYAYYLSMLDSMAGSLKGYETLELESQNSWFSKSAQDGFPLAKYELGRRLSYGQQCAVDSRKSYFWLEGAANDNVADAKLFLGVEIYYGSRYKQDFNKGLALIKAAADGGLPEAQLKYAWILSTSPDKDVFNPEVAMEYFNLVKKKEFHDMLSYLETKAAVSAANSDYKAASSALKKASKERKRYELGEGVAGDMASSIASKSRFVQQI